MGLFRQAYRQYCWPINQLEDYTLAPFHLMASEGAVHTEKPHSWHMDTLARVAKASPKLITATPHRVVNLGNEAEEAEATAWWQSITAEGAEGMVVKPMDFLVMKNNLPVQPALKVRGQEYLRIIYGPDYTEPAQLKRLRTRNTGRKRSMAMREFALGVEALNRFVNHQPLTHVHQCTFGVLALESESVDPRL